MPRVCVLLLLLSVYFIATHGAIGLVSQTTAIGWRNIIESQLQDMENKLFLVPKYETAFTSQPLVFTTVKGQERVALLAVQLGDILEAHFQLLSDAAVAIANSWGSGSAPSGYHVG